MESISNPAVSVVSSSAHDPLPKLDVIFFIYQCRLAGLLYYQHIRRDIPLVLGVIILNYKLFIVAISCAVLLSACGTNDKYAAAAAETHAALSTLQSHGYTVLRYAKMLDRSPSLRNWVAVCRDLQGNEYMVVLDPSGKRLSSTIQLDTGGRLTYEQMKNSLERKGVDASNLGPYLSRDDVLYWQCQDHIYSLSGVQNNQFQW